MALTPIFGFRSVDAQHCVSGAMLHIFRFHGSSVTEATIFGLGAGLGFAYWHHVGAAPLIGGRGNLRGHGEEELVVRAARRLGVSAERAVPGDDGTAERALLDTLAHGEPVMCMVDEGLLPYLDLPEGFHFGGHAIVIAGHDPVARTVLVSDRDAGFHEIPLDALADARASTGSWIPPERAWWRFDFDGMRAPHPDDVCASIHEVTGHMLDAPVCNLGVSGIAKAAREIGTWPTKLTPLQLRQACGAAAMCIDAGTGAGAFRHLYARLPRRGGPQLRGHRARRDQP